MAKIGEYFVQLGVDGAGQVKSALASVHKNFQSMADASLAPIRSVSSALHGLLNPISMVSTALGALGVSAGVGSMIRLASDAEQTSVAFEVLLGSMQQAQRMVADLKKFAAATPFEMPGLSQAAKILLQFGRPAEQVMADLDMLSNVAMGDQQKLLALATVFGQISSTARLTGGDLLQLINAGFNPLQIISKQTGMSMAELKEAMEKGQISAEMVRWAFESATSAGGQFYGMNQKMSQTLGGLWSTAADAVKSSLTSIGQTLIETFDLKGIVANLGAWVEQYKTTFAEGIQAVLVGLQAFLTPIWEGIVATVGTAVEWIKAHWTSLQGAAEGLMAVLGGLWSYFQAFGGAVLAVAGPIVDLVGQIGQWISRNKELVSAIGTALGIVAAVTVAVNVLTGAVGVLSTVLGALLSPIGLISAAIVALGLLFPDTFRGAIAAVKDFIANWDLYFKIAFESTKLFLSNLWERLKAFFTNAAILVAWLMRQWHNLWLSIWRAGTTIFSNLIKNLQSLWTAFMTFLQTGRWTMDWTPLLEGFQSAIETMPDLVSAQVQETTPALDRLYDELARRRAEAAREAPQLAKALGAPAGTVGTAAAAALPALPGFPTAPAKPPKEAKPEKPPKEPKPEKPPKEAAAEGPKISFVALEALATQMQEEAGKKIQEEIAAASRRNADATERLAGTVQGDALRVVVANQAPATYS